MWVKLKPSLVFNWVISLGGFSVPLTLIQTVNLNSKFHSFLLRILIRKDNRDNKIFKKEFYTKKERGRKDIVLQIFSTICGRLMWESVWETKFFEFEHFSFLFFFFVLSKSSEAH